MEQKWMKQVYYEMSVGLREQAIFAWKAYLKYKNVVRTYRERRYFLFMLECNKLVEKTRKKLLDMQIYHENKQMWKSLCALSAHVPVS